MNQAYKILFLLLILLVLVSGISCAPSSKSGRNAIQPVHYRPSWGHYHHHYNHYRPPPYGPHRRY